MENWKIVVIALLLGGLFGYGFYQSRPAPINPPGVQPTPTPDPRDLVMLGKPAPGWAIPAQYWANTPRPITLQDLKGKATLLEFWRSSCSHCAEATPFMVGLYNQYKPQGLQIVAFQSPINKKDPDNPDNQWDAVQQVIKDWGLSYPVAFDKDGVLFKTKYNGRLWPTLVLLDRQGKVVFYQTGHDATKARALVRAIERALGKQPSGGAGTTGGQRPGEAKKD